MLYLMKRLAWQVHEKGIMELARILGVIFRGPCLVHLLSLFFFIHEGHFPSLPLPSLVNYITSRMSPLPCKFNFSINILLIRLLLAISLLHLLSLDHPDITHFSVKCIAILLPHTSSSSISPTCRACNQIPNSARYECSGEGVYW